MKLTTVIYVIIFISTLHNSIFAEDNYNEILDSNITWNLLRDIKDHDAGRLKILEKNRSQIIIPDDDSDYVIITGIPDDPNKKIDFGISFPLLKPQSKKIKMIVIDIELQWLPQGEIKFTLDNQYSTIANFGICLKCDENPPQLYLGPFYKESIPINISKYNFPVFIGMKIIYKPIEETITFAYSEKKASDAVPTNFQTFTKKVKSFQPKQLSFTADNFMSLNPTVGFTIRKFKMMINCKENLDQ